MPDNDESADPTRSMRPSNHRTTRGTIRVLHVDDNADLATLTSAYLEKEDDRFEVDTQPDGESGLAALEDTDYDCVVSDYEMPGLHGIEFLAAVRERYPALPFILFTGKGSEEVASEAISAGVTDYVQKRPGRSSFDVLLNRIENAVDQSWTRQELDSSRDRLSLFFEQSPLGVIEWDEQFQCVRLNPAAEAILGYAEHELVGRPWEVIVPESDRPDVAAVVDGLLEGEGGFHHIHENVRGDGERITCEWHNRVVTDDDGSVVAIFSQFQDITERRRQERRLKTLISNLPGMVYRSRIKRGWPMEEVWGEVETLTGYSRAEPWDAGLYGNEIVHPEDREFVWQEVQDALSAGDSFELTYRIVTSGGTVKWVWERGRRVVDENGSQEVLEGFITDVTDRAAPPDGSG